MRWSEKERQIIFACNTAAIHNRSEYIWLTSRGAAKMSRD